MARPSRFARTLCCFSLVVGCVLAVEAGAGTALMYRFKPGETVTYAVKIIADRPDAVETYEGTIELAVKTSGPEGTSLVPSASLPGKIRSRIAPTPGKGKGAPGGGGSMPITLSPAKGNPAAREVTFDSYGNVIAVKGDIGLSYLLGSVSRLVIEPMSRTAEKTWQRSKDTVLREIESIGSFKGPTNETRSAAKEVVNYEVVSTMDSIVRIKKTSSFQTAATGEDGPRVQLHGSGELVFDAKAGLMKTGEYQAMLTISEANLTVKVPLTVSYRLMDATEVAALKVQAETAKREHEERMAKLKEATANRVKEMKAISDEDITKALDEIKVGGLKAFRAADRLAAADPVSSRRDEVSAALDELGKSTDGTSRAYAAKALGSWATPANMPTLLAMLKDTNPFAKGHAIEALGAVKDVKAAEALAPLLAEFGLSAKAAASLRAIGPVGEKAVQPYLRHQKPGVRLEACKILADIGTKQSLVALKAAAADRDRNVAVGATTAIQAIQKRK